MVNAPAHTQAGAFSLSASRAHCLRLAREHYENFTVLSRLTPRDLRPHRAALYAFCRTVDDLGDEAAGDRMVLLDRFEEGLDEAMAGRGRGAVFTALSETIARFNLPREPAARLIEANRIDQRSRRYETFDDLLSYCEHSANPVGHLVLMIHGHRDDKRFSLSDATCTALQLANFWQDVSRDLARGRVYIPQEDLDSFGVMGAELRASEASGPVRALLRFEVERAREFFRRGLPLLDQVHGRLRVELALFSRGGLAILDAIRTQDYDTLRARPALSSRTKRRIVASTLVSLAVGRRPWT